MIIYVVFRFESKRKAAEFLENETFCRFILEQDTGLEPAAYCLGSSRSTG